MCWSDIIVAVIQLLTALLVAFLMFRYALKQMRKESKENIERKKYEEILSAHRSVYKLLAYTTDTENPKSIMIWERVKGKNAEIKYFFRKSNIIEFMNELPKVFYEDGNGLFLSAEISELLFEYRSILYGFLLSIKENNELIFEITQPKAVERMKQIHQELTVKIRQNLGITQRDLMKL